MTTGLNTGNAKAALVERGDDLYETPAVATAALLRVEELPEIIWEPACGPGSIVGTLRSAGHKVYATDLVDYGCPDSEARIDFLSQAALALLGDLTIIPQAVGYDHRIKELDESKPRLIQWIAGEGYFVSDAGRALLAQREG